MENRNSEKETEIQRDIAGLYVKYRMKLFLFVSASVQSTCIADDIVQDVFLEVLKKYDSFKSHPNQIGWLYRTAMYKIREYERRLQMQDILDIEGEVQGVGDKEKGYFETELGLLLDEELTSEEHRRFVRYFLWGYSVEEMALLEGVSLNNMRVRLSRLKKKIMEQAI